MERTFALCKPDAFEKRVVGRVLSRIEDEGFRVVEARLVRLTWDEAAAFYAEHAGKSFFEPLVAFMSSGPVLAMVLEHARGTFTKWRMVIGASDARRAAYDTIRERHGDKTGLAIWRNVVHGSDSPEAAAREIAMFFPSDADRACKAIIRRLTEGAARLVPLQNCVAEAIEPRDVTEGAPTVEQLTQKAIDVLVKQQRIIYVDGTYQHYALKVGAEMHAFHRVDGQLKDVTADRGLEEALAGEAERVRVYKAILEGTPLASPGNRWNSVTRAAAMLAHVLPAGTAWRLAVEFLRPCIAAMDCSPEGIDHWLGHAEASYRRAQEREAVRKPACAACGGSGLTGCGGNGCMSCTPCGACGGDRSLDALHREELERALSLVTVDRHPPAIRQARKALGLTQAEIGMEVDYAPESISRMESGTSPVQAVYAVALRGLLREAIDELTGGAR